MVDEFDEIDRPRRRRWLAALLVNILILAMLALAAHVLLSRTGIITVQSIIASRISLVSSELDGKIVKIFVDSNEQFKTSQPLFQIENSDVLDNIAGLNKIIEGYDGQIAEEQSELSRRVRESDLQMKIQTVQQQMGKNKILSENTQEALKNADGLTSEAKANWESAQSLLRSGAITRARVESYRFDYQKAVAEREKIANDLGVLNAEILANRQTLATYKQQLEDLTKLTDARLAELREKRKIRETERNKWESARDRFLVKADRDGFVATRQKEEGDRVKSGEAVLKVTTGEDIWVEAYFKPEDANLVHAGDPLVIRYANATFPVIVESIGLITEPFPLQRVSMLAQPENYVVIRMVFVQPDQAKKAGLRPGMQVNTEIVRQEGLLFWLGLKQAKLRADVQIEQEPTTSTRASK